MIKLLPFLFMMPGVLSASSAPAAVGASGAVHETISVVYSEALNNAVKFLEEKGEFIPQNALKNTLQAFGSAMNKSLSAQGYRAFIINNSQTYARAFLLSGLVRYADFDVDNVTAYYGDNCQASLNWKGFISDNVDYDDAFGNVSYNNPLPVYSVTCQAPTLLSSGNTRVINDITESDVYTMPYKGRYLTAPTPDDMFSFIESDNRDIALNLFRIASDSFILTKVNEVRYEEGKPVPVFSSCSLSPWQYSPVKRERGSYINYSVNHSPVRLHSDYSGGYTFTALTNCYYSDISQGSNGVQHNYGEGNLSITVTAPPYNEDSHTSSVISLFSENDVFPSWGESVRKRALPASQIAAFINNLWSLAARQSEYNGIPFYSSFQITPERVNSVINQRGISLSLYNLLEPVSADYSLLRWDEKFNAFVSEEMQVQGDSVNVDFGDAPENSLPDLPQSSAESALAPLLSMLPFLRDFELNPHAAQCPVASFTALQREYSITTHCDLFERFRTLISLFFTISWSFLGLRLLLK